MEQIYKYKKYLEEKELSDNTIIAYSSAVRDFLRLFSGLSRSELDAYRRWLAGKYAVRTANVKISAVNKYLDFLNQSALRLKLLKYQEYAFRDDIISDEEYEHLKESLNNPAEKKWFFVVWFLGATGTRVSEMLQLRVEDLLAGSMDINGKGSKSRRVYIPEALQNEAAAYCRSREKHAGFFFQTRTGKQMSRFDVYRQLKKKARKYSINPDVIYPHSFRHYFAKRFLEKNGDLALLADLLGHTNIETTRIYLRKSNEEIKSLVNQTVNW